MNAQIIQRYIWLVTTIQSAGYIRKEELDRRWAMSALNEDKENTYPARKFFRHKWDIADIFQIDIEYDRVKGYYIAPGSSIQGTQLQEWMMNNFAVGNALTESQHIRERVLLEPIPSGAAFLLPIIAAMRNSQVLEMEYHKFGGDHQVLELEPYCVRVFKQRWYVYGVPSTHPNERRIYALDRIGRLQPMDKHFEIPSDFDAQAEFAHYYGAFTDGKAEIVRVRVNEKGRDYLRSLPLHPSQQEVTTLEHDSEFEWFISPTFDFIQQLHTFGSQLVVLQPEWLRNKMVEEINRMRANYK